MEDTSHSLVTGKGIGRKWGFGKKGTLGGWGDSRSGSSHLAEDNATTVGDAAGFALRYPTDVL